LSFKSTATQLDRSVLCFLLDKKRRTTRLQIKLSLTKQTNRLPNLNPRHSPLKRGVFKVYKLVKI